MIESERNSIYSDFLKQIPGWGPPIWPTVSCLRFMHRSAGSAAWGEPCSDQPDNAIIDKR